MAPYSVDHDNMGDASSPVKSQEQITAEELHRLYNEKDELNEELDRVIKEKLVLQNKLEDSEKRIDDFFKSQAALQHEKEKIQEKYQRYREDTEVSIKNLQKVRSKLQHEVNELKYKLQEKKEQVVLSIDSNPILGEINKILDRLKELQGLTESGDVFIVPKEYMAPVFEKQKNLLNLAKISDQIEKDEGLRPSSERLDYVATTNDFSEEGYESFLRNSVRTKDNELTHKDDVIKDLEKAVTVREERLKNLEQEMLNKTRDYQILADDFNGIKADLGKEEDKSKRLLKQIEELSCKGENLETDLQETHKELNSRATEIEKKHGKIEEKNAEIDRLNRDIDSLLRQREIFETEAREKTDKVMERNSKIKKLTKRLNEVEIERNNRGAQIITKDNEIARLKTQLSELKDQVNKMFI